MTYDQRAIEANQRCAASFNWSQLAMPPAKKLAGVASMDARLTVEEFLGLKTGDAVIFGHAGGLVTDDALRSLIISTKWLGTREFYVVNHTDCGMLTFTDEQVREQLTQETGADAGSLVFRDFQESGGKRLRPDRHDPEFSVHPR